MARNFGSTGASSLLRAATAGLNQTNNNNDQMAAIEYDNSIKDQAAYQKYANYLNGRINTAKTSDPTKALSLSRTLTSANRSFNSAEIGRMSDQVRTGAIDNRSKYAAMVDLFNRAGQNGDYNLQQNLGSQLDSLSVTIQNEDKAKADAATTAGNKAQSAARAGYTAANNKGDAAIATLESGLRTGQKVLYNGQMIHVTPTILATMKGQWLAAKAQNLQSQISSGLDTDTGTIAKQLSELKASGDYIKYASPEGYGSIASGQNVQSMKFDPRTNTYSMVDTPYKLDQNGNATYAAGKQGSGDYLVNRQAGTDTQGGAQQESFLLPGFTQKDANGNVTSKGYFDPVAKKTILDMTGQDGPLNYAPLDKGETPASLAALNAKAGKDNAFGLTDAGAYGNVIGNNFNNLLSHGLNTARNFAIGGAKGAATGGPLGFLTGGVQGVLSGLFSRNDQAVAAQKAAQAAAQAAQAKAYIAPTTYNVARPAPAPIPVPKAIPTTYNYKAPAAKQITYAPLPGQPGYVNPVGAALSHPATPAGGRAALKDLITF